MGAKTYREIKPNSRVSTFDGAAGCATDESIVGKVINKYEEDDIMFFKAIGRYGEPGVGTDEFRPEMRMYKMTQTGIDFDNSPDSEVLSCETTLSSNDVRLELTSVAPKYASAICTTTNNFRIYTIFHFQGAMSLFPGNECRLLVV